MRPSSLLCSVAVLCSFASLGSSLKAADDAESLLRFMPSDSNAIAVVRVREILDTPRAKREGWKDQTARFLAGAESIPTYADALVLGTQFQPGNTQGWTASALLCPAGISVRAMAKDENRPVQQLGGVDAMHTVRDAYLLQLSPQVLGVMSPALRQESSRWVRSVANSSEPQLSPYLLEAARSPSHIVMAVDMLDMLDPRLIRNRLESTKLLEGKDDVVDELTELFKGLQGVALHIRVESDTDARIELAFSDNLPDNPEAFKTLILEMLRDQGLALQDFNDGTASIDGAVFRLSAKLSDDQLRDALTMILSPYPASPTDTGAIATARVDQPETPSTQEQEAAAKKEIIEKNQRYYSSLRRVFDDAKRTTSTAWNYSQSAGYLDRYAARIDNLPREGVDPILQDFAAYCSDQMRTLAAATRYMVTDVNTQEGTITTRVTNAGVTPVVTGYRRGGWYRRGGVTYGYAPHWNVESNLQQVRERQAESITSTSGVVEEIKLKLESRHAQVKREMEEKYGVEFSRYGY